MYRRFLSRFFLLGGLLALWHGVAVLSGNRPYLLPDPFTVFLAVAQHRDTLIFHAAITLVEIVLGLFSGVLLGALTALIMVSFRSAARWIMPVIILSQTIPFFALAPLLTLWLGYGPTSKIAMAVLIIYVPVTTVFFDGLRRTDLGWLDLAQTMNASRFRTLLHIRLPAALPALASGIRMATIAAPIGAIIGEWTGSSAGLGYLMLHANGRMQTPLLFAALLTLTLLSIALYHGIDILLRRLLPWQADSSSQERHQQ